MTTEENKALVLHIVEELFKGNGYERLISSLWRH